MELKIGEGTCRESRSLSRQLRIQRSPADTQIGRVDQLFDDQEVWKNISKETLLRLLHQRKKAVQWGGR